MNRVSPCESSASRNTSRRSASGTSAKWHGPFAYVMCCGPREVRRSKSREPRLSARRWRQRSRPDPPILSQLGKTSAARCASNFIGSRPPGPPGCSDLGGREPLSAAARWRDWHGSGAEGTFLGRVRGKAETEAGEKGNIRFHSASGAVGQHPDPDHEAAHFRNAGLRLRDGSAGRYHVVDHQDARAGRDHKTTAQDATAPLAPLDIKRLHAKLAGDLVSKNDAARCGTGDELDAGRVEIPGNHRRQLHGRSGIFEDAEFLEVIGPM